MPYVNYVTRFDICKDHLECALAGNACPALCGNIRTFHSVCASNRGNARVPSLISHLLARPAILTRMRTHTHTRTQQNAAAHRHTGAYIYLPVCARERTASLFARGNHFLAIRNKLLFVVRNTLSEMSNDYRARPGRQLTLADDEPDERSLCAALIILLHHIFRAIFKPTAASTYPMVIK